MKNVDGHLDSVKAERVRDTCSSDCQWGKEKLAVAYVCVYSLDIAGEIFRDRVSKVLVNSSCSSPSEEDSYTKYMLE